jgi:hypothetical protein
MMPAPITATAVRASPSFISAITVPLSCAVDSAGPPLVSALPRGFVAALRGYEIQPVPLPGGLGSVPGRVSQVAGHTVRVGPAVAWRVMAVN